MGSPAAPRNGLGAAGGEARIRPRCGAQRERQGNLRSKRRAKACGLLLAVGLFPPGAMRGMPPVAQTMARGVCGGGNRGGAEKNSINIRL